MSITNLEQLSKILTLKEEEKEWRETGPSLSMLISDNVLSVMDKDDPDDPIRREFVPTKYENITSKESIDPLREVEHSKTERLIHRYHNRAALLVTSRCYAYCRHCFRRRFTSNDDGKITKEELDEAAGYLREHTGIKEVLLTGGDMFTLSDEEINRLLGVLKEAREDVIYRLCTRALFSAPERFTPALMSIIKKHMHGAPFLLMCQFNHPRELNDKAVKAVSAFVDMGIPAFNQAVLLEGVNDDVDTLEELSNKLLYNRIKPYYLFQGDMVDGTAHLRCSLKKGLEIEKELRKRLSGVAMPQYTIDLPEGGGKVILTENYVIGLKDGLWQIKSPFQGKRDYPEKDESAI